MTPEQLDDLEQQALASESGTLRGTFYNALVQGGELLELVRTRKQLEQLRAHKGLSTLLATLQSDRDDWAHNERHGLEDYEGEARERREAYDLAIALLQSAETEPTGGER